MSVTVEQFLTQVVDLELLTQIDLDNLLSGYSTESSSLSTEMIENALTTNGKMTPFQAKAILQGNGKSLLLGNYLLLDKIGEGGMGIVYKAMHRRMKRIVALKVLSPKLTETPELASRFQREVEATARLENQYIVTAYDADESEGTHFLVMQFIDGENLSSIVKHYGSMNLDDALNCMIQIATGMSYAHERGIIHRDIKPSNLLLDTEGIIKILDLGLARILDNSNEQTDISNTGNLMGTVDYIAPEQALNTKNADARSDIYSMGITFWFLLTGKPTYMGDSVVAKLLAHRDQEIPKLSHEMEDIPEEIDALFQKMVAKDPEDRFQTASEVIHTIKRFLTETESIAQSTLQSKSTLLDLIEIPKDSKKHPITKDEYSQNTTYLQSQMIDTDLDIASNSKTRHDSENGRALLSGSLKSTTKWWIMTGIGILLFLITAFAVYSFSNRSNKPAQPSSEKQTVLKTDRVALSFNGVDNYVQTPYAFNNAHPITFEAWITISPDESTVEKYEIFSNAETAGFSFHVKIIKGKWLLRMLLNDGKHYVPMQSKLAIQPNRKTHVAATYDGISLALFIDGQKQGTNVPVRRRHHESPLHVLLGANPDPKLIGRRVATQRDYFKGLIHQCRITKGANYTKNFSPSKIFETNKNTILLYHIEEATGTVLHDLSGNDYDGQIVGARWVNDSGKLSSSP